MKRSRLTFTILATLALLAGAGAGAGASGAAVPTHVTLLVGYPDQDEAGGANGVLVVPGTVIPIDVELAGGPPSIDAELKRSVELDAMRAKLARALRLETVEARYSTVVPLELGAASDLPGPADGSDVSLRITLIGFTDTTASYQVQFFERSAVLADTPVAVARGKRAVVGGVDGDEAPYLFLIVEPTAAGERAGKDAPRWVEGDVVAPKALHKVPPQYTEEARKAGLEGQVIITAVIDQTGNVAEVRVIKSLDPGLDQAAADAIRTWRFAPATLDGKPVAVYYNLTVNFRLGDKKREE